MIGDSDTGETNNNLATANKSKSILSTKPPKAGRINYWGNPDLDADYWREQRSEISCALVAQVGIYESITGEFISETDAATYAEDQGWYDPLTGTSLKFTGSLLADLGLETNRAYDNTFDDLVAALSDGDKVIAAVDADEIWEPRYNSSGRAIEQTVPGAEAHEDFNHAVWVTGVEQNSDNSWSIILNDSGVAYGQEESVDYQDFMNAWNDSDNFLTIVDA